MSRIGTYQEYVRQPSVVYTIGILAAVGFVADSLFFSYSDQLKTLNYFCAGGITLVVIHYFFDSSKPWYTIGGYSVIFALNLLAAPFLELETANFAAFYLRNSLFYWVLIPIAGLIWNTRTALISALVYLLQLTSVLILTEDTFLFESLSTILIVLGIYSFVNYSLIKSLKDSIREQSDLISDLETKTSELDTLVDTKNKLLSVVSHDLRSPIMNLSSISFLINDKISEHKDEELTEYSHLMENAVNSTRDLVTNLLKWSQTQNKTITIRPEQVPIKPSVQKAIDLTSHISSQKGIDINIRSFETDQVFADPDSLDILLRNIIGNALKFTGTGGKVDVWTEKNSSHVIIHIEDNGLGMSSEDLASLLNTNIFNSKKGTEQEKGSGLGFNLCLELIELHSGEITASSEPDAGTRISLHFPHPSSEQ